MLFSATTSQSYRLSEYIGEGHFSHVYGCEDSWKNALVAKAIKPRGLPKKDVTEKAFEEIEKLVLLRHPNITYIYDAFEHRDTPVIVSERCDGTLRSMFSSQFTGQVWLLPIARCLLQAVDFIHGSGHVHRDLHLDNVMVRYIRDEVVPEKYNACVFKVGDLGLCTAANALHQDSTFAEWIRPPEAIDGDEYGVIDGRLDLYHLGLIFLQIMVGKVLTFSRQDILNGEPRKLALQLDPPFSFAIEKCLRRHVEYRSATAREVWRDLNSPA